MAMSFILCIFAIWLPKGQDYVQHYKNRLEDKNRNKNGSKNHSKLFATISPYSRE